MKDPQEIQAVPPLRAFREFSGRGMVIAMLLFGAAATYGLWLYWHFHYAPFRPLQDAIVAEFPGSAPRVEGGQPKMHQQTPHILRITLQVDFDPTVDESRGEIVSERLQQIARAHHDVSVYDALEIYLFQRVPEQESREKRYEYDLQSSPAAH